MRALKRMLLALCAVVLALAFVAAPAYADSYEYDVRIFAGNHGTFGGDDVVTLGTYAEGTEITVTRQQVEDMLSMEDGTKYYVKGFRVSGQDTLYSSYTFDVNEDTDLIVAYGVEGAMTSYTIHFVVEATGQELGSATFTGKVGDKPVESYEYFEGYRPLYRNITGTLREGSNDWTLPYVAVEAPTETTTVETTTTTTTTAAAAAAAPAAEGAAAAAPAAEGAAAAAPGAEGAAAAATPEATAPATEEILDVDTPLAGPGGTGTNGTGTNGTGTNGTGTETTIGGDGTPLANAASAVGSNGFVILAVVALALLAFLLLRNRGGDEGNE